MRYLGNFSAVEPVYTRRMYCWECQVEWDGCWDNFMCPICGKGELPSSNIDNLMFKLSKEKL
jgi:hypothetical protein